MRAGPEGGDLVRDIGRVVLDPAQQRRAPGVLPQLPEEVEAGRRRHAAPVHGPAVFIEHWDVYPRVIDSEAGCPDDAADVQVGSVSEADGGSRRTDGSAMELDA